MNDNINLYFAVEKQVIRRIDNEVIAQYAQCIYTANFAFDASWDAFETKIAQFRHLATGETYNAEVIDNKCEVPWTIFKTIGTVQVGVVGGQGVNQITTTTGAHIVVLESVYDPDGNYPAEPEPGLITSAVQETKAYMLIAEEAANTAVEAKSEAARLAEEAAKLAKATEEAAKKAQEAAKTAMDAIQAASDIALQAASKAYEAAEAAQRAAQIADKAAETANTAAAEASSVSDELAAHKVDPDTHENLELDGNNLS